MRTRTLASLGPLREDVAPCRPAMPSSIEDRAEAVSSPRRRPLARAILGVTILGIAAGVWVSILDVLQFAVAVAYCGRPVGR
jgi:hypothetical protein